MEYIYSVEEATQKLFDRLCEAMGWKFLKNRKSLKKTVKDLVFEILFFSSKWNASHQNIEINAEFRLINKSYGKLPVNNVVASISYRPDGGTWYDISTEDKLNAVFEELNAKMQATAVSLCGQFEADPKAAAKGLLNDHFEEYNVYLDFIADTLGKDAITDKAQEIIADLSEEMKRQLEDYKNGSRDKMWMINRCNLKYIADNDLL